MKQIPHRLHSLLPSRSYEGYHNCPHTDTNQNMTDHFFCTCSGQWYNFPCIHRVSAVVKPQEQEVMTSSRSQYGHLFADDVVLFSESPQELQLMVEELRTASNKVDLEINLSETKVMLNINVEIQPIMSGNVALDQVDRYTYLGQLISIHRD
ncbi:putative uncharacterized transposon-derived protein F52C9.6 [Nymphon striatum]|nr:putative uncharacterized transposon-derived protein F52C9.6 [Nymphon striatum]